MSTLAGINSYEGAGYLPGSPAGSRKKTSAQSIKESHRKLTRAFIEIGQIALNAADYERTMMLPVGRGRLACDETGDFDAGAVRPAYNPSLYSQYPRHVHSTVTDGEYIEVADVAAHIAALETRKWSDKPMEKRRRFKLTPEDQMQDLKAQIESERAARLFQEREIEARMAAAPEVTITAANPESDLLRLELQQEREHRKMLEARVEAILAKFESVPASAVAVAGEDETDEEEDEEADDAAITVQTAVKRGRR